MSVFGSKLKRRIWQPFVLLSLVAVAASLVFTVVPPTPALLWVYTAVLVAAGLTMAGLLSRRLVSSLQGLARAAEQISPGTVERAAQHSDEIAALTETVSTITTEIREKEQTWMGDLERRNKAVQQMSRSLQEQAASFETALNSVDLPVCLFESNGNLLQVNQRFCQFLGSSPDVLKAMGLLAIVAGLRKYMSAPDELTAAAEAIYRRSSVPTDQNFTLREGRGTLRLYCVPIFGELSSMVGIIISTAENADATAVERLKTEFISTVSHELRTPLTAIKGAVGLVLGGAGGPVPGPIRDLLEIAGNNTERLIQLVSDILEIFRMETGKLKLQPAPVGTPELVAKACAGVETEAAEANIRLETRLAPGLPAVLADAEQMQKVFEKLLSNAIKFSSPGGAVQIGAEMMKDEPKFVQFWVQDFGVGIPAEAQERIFEKFEQAESVLTRQHQGSGLGLAICRGVVEGHGGRIWVRSEPGKGSTFFLNLPIAQSVGWKSSTRMAAKVPAASPGAGQRLVMVVEDDADTRSVLTRMLQSAGHFVVEVALGSQVAELAVRHHPEVITLDLILPDMDGLEVLRRLKGNEQTRRIPVICVSISDELSSEAMELGAAEFIRKPLEAATLLKAIQAVCAPVAGGSE